MGVVVFSVFMISSFVQVLVESIERLFAGSETALSIPLTSMVVMWVTIAVKGVVWLWCRRKKNTSVKALAQDAENDWWDYHPQFYLSSAFWGRAIRHTYGIDTKRAQLGNNLGPPSVLNIFSLLFPYIGQKFNIPWLDAVGGLILSIYSELSICFPQCLGADIPLLKLSPNGQVHSLTMSGTLPADEQILFNISVWLILSPGFHPWFALCNTVTYIKRGMIWSWKRKFYLMLNICALHPL